MYKYTLLTVILCFDIAASLTDYNNNKPNNVDKSIEFSNFCEERGKRQSPINIRMNGVIKDFERQFIKYGQLKFNGYDNVLMTGINYEHTIKFSTDGDRHMHPTVTGGPLKYTYHLKEVTFHWPSEHSINSVKYPMEIHLVHVRADLEMTEALNKKDGLAVISLFCNVSVTTNDNEKDDTEELMQYLPTLMENGDRISGVLINLRKLLGPSSGSYFTYLGSLTTPECNEVVVWIIFQDPIYISDNNYRRFTDTCMGQHNFRSQQKLNRHIIFQSPDSFITTPQAIQIIVNAVNTITEIFKNVTSVIIKGLKNDS